jgi:hypothetical protein
MWIIKKITFFEFSRGQQVEICEIVLPCYRAKADGVFYRLTVLW